MLEIFHIQYHYYAFIKAFIKFRNADFVAYVIYSIVSFNENLINIILMVEFYKFLTLGFNRTFYIDVWCFL